MSLFVVHLKAADTNSVLFSLDHALLKSVALGVLHADEQEPDEVAFSAAKLKIINNK